MANSYTTQIIEDGPRNTILKLTGLLDTADEAYTVKIAPADVSPVPAQFRVDHLDYSISDGIECQLFWDATAPEIIQPLAGRGRMSFCNFGGLQNNAGAGKTGSIGLSTTALGATTYTSGKPLTYSIILELVKQGV